MIEQDEMDSTNTQKHMQHTFGEKRRCHGPFKPKASMIMSASDRYSFHALGFRVMVILVSYAACLHHGNIISKVALPLIKKIHHHLCVYA
jgi:hypothetical protein|uniref:Uncharacterized protein n=1 Tax=Picea glauca TaxID=3330 RepID=A0A101LVB5_PICGL|nr:hypothetical protein ABT39_MTgene2135 [Picea glauca]QHR86896.1 hypothetical protein Q903MT_gene903 [Picea sitchensis]